MLARGLAMLWEDTDPTAALQERFGLTGFDGAARWLTATLQHGWGVRVSDVERILVSDSNALAWVRTDTAVLVIKVASRAEAFARLDAIADLLGSLTACGLPVAAPLPDQEGRRRHIVETDRALSAAVHPRVDGDLLDVADLVAVHATGELVGRLHVALAEVDPAPFAGGPREILGDLRTHVIGTLSRLPQARAPHAFARLTDLLGTLPDIEVPPRLGHGDIRGANVLVRDHRVAAVLDFDELSIRHRSVEISLGAVLLATGFRRWPPAPPVAQDAFLRGYESVVTLTDAERGWCEALRLWFGLRQIRGDDPEGWAAAVERSA